MRNYERSNLLFCDIDLRATLEAQRRGIDTEVQALDENRLLNTSQDDLINYLVEKNFVETPRLLRDRWSADSKEVTELREDYGRRISVTAQRLEVEVPFSGEGELFKARASTFTTAPPRARVGSHSLFLEFSLSRGADAASVKDQISRELDEIERHLDWTRADVDSHNREILSIAKRAVEHRRARILEGKGLVAGLGIPLKERGDTTKTFVAPEIRRRLVPTLPAASTAPYKPEPVLAMEQYEHIVRVLESMTKVMERSPSTFAKMKEEALRDNYLVQLNGHYQGAATGETFNASGKTDILLRIQDKNVFIAECKFWKGAKGYAETIDQLLGYSSWRDTKTAILVFNRNRDTSKVLQEVRAATEAHRSYKRTVPWSHESGFRFIMHHPGDQNRELIMTVLVFDIPVLRA